MDSPRAVPDHVSENIESVAQLQKVFGARVVAVVMTGMGEDGLQGARAVHAVRGKILTEAESSCVVYGMPRAIVEANLADDIFALDQMAPAIAAEVNR